MFTLMYRYQNMNYASETGKILDSLECPFNVNDFNENIFDSVKWLCNTYNDNSQTNGDLKSRQIKEILSYLPHICNKKELLLALLEEINRFKGHEKYFTLIGPIQKCLQLTPINFTSTFQAYNILCTNLKSEPIAATSLECVESLQEDEKYSENRVIAKLLLDNFSFFVDELHSKLKQDKHDPAIKKAIEEFSLILLRIFSRPLGFLFLNCEPESCEHLCLSLFEKLQNNAVNYTLKTLDSNEKDENRRLNKNNYKAGEDDEDIDDDDDDDIDEIEKSDIEIGCGILCYLIFSATYAGNLVPQVYSKPYLVEVLAPVINKLLSNEYNDMHLVHKGCSLMLNILAGIGKRGLEPTAFDNECLKDLVVSLVRLIEHCRVKEVIQMCVQCINALLWALHPKDRLAYLGCIIRATNSPSLQGFGITALKNQLQEEGPDSFDSKVLNSSLHYIFSMTTKSSSSTTLIDHMDRLMPTINFLIYLVIRDKAKMKEFALSPIIQFAVTNFLKPLKQEIEHFKSQCLEEMEVVRRDKTQLPDDLLANITIGNGAKEDLTNADREAVLKKLLIDADLMGCAVGRVESLVGNSDGEVNVPKAPPNTVAPSSVFEPIVARCVTNTRLAPFQ